LASCCANPPITVRHPSGRDTASASLRSERSALAHGEAHLAIVLRLIVETKGNAAELHAATIKAVSAVVDSGLVDVDGALFEAMDGIDLRKLRLWSQAARVARAGGGRASVVDTMAAALLWQLASPEKLKVAA
jgi:ABC-type tungstate transport system permease subunit